MVKPAISLESALTKVLVEEEEDLAVVVALEVTPAEAAEDKNVTSVAKLATSHVTVPRGVLAATEVEDTLVEADMVVDTAAVAEEDKPATPAVDTATCLATALRAKSATTVSLGSLPNLEFFVNQTAGGEVGHLSRDCPQEASSERVCYKCKQPGHVQAACPN